MTNVDYRIVTSKVINNRLLIIQIDIKEVICALEFYFIALIPITVWRFNAVKYTLYYICQIFSTWKLNFVEILRSDPAAAGQFRAAVFLSQFRGGRIGFVVFRRVGTAASVIDADRQLYFAVG